MSEFSERNKLINQLLESEGKEKGELKRTLMMGSAYGKTLEESSETAEDLRKRGIAAGSAYEIIDFLHLYEEAGCQRVMLQWLELDDLDGLAQMGNDLLKEFRS